MIRLLIHMRAVLFRCLSRDTTRGSIIMYNRWVVCLWCEVSMVTRHLIGFMGVCPVIVRIIANNRGTRPAASGRAHNVTPIKPPWCHAPQRSLSPFLW